MKKLFDFKLKTNLPSINIVIGGRMNGKKYWVAKKMKEAYLKNKEKYDKLPNNIKMWFDEIEL